MNALLAFARAGGFIACAQVAAPGLEDDRHEPGRERQEELMATILMESDDGALDSASAVLRGRATNPEYNQPALRIDQASARGGAASIKIVDPNPDIEFVESGTADADHPARGKYEIAVQSDELQINGRKDDDSGFETIMVFQRRGGGGDVRFPTG